MPVEKLTEEQITRIVDMHDRGKLLFLRKPPYDCPDCSAKIVTLEWQPDKDCFKMTCPACKTDLYI